MPHSVWWPRHQLQHLIPTKEKDKTKKPNIGSSNYQIHVFTGTLPTNPKRTTNKQPRHMQPACNTTPSLAEPFECIGGWCRHPSPSNFSFVHPNYKRSTPRENQHCDKSVYQTYQWRPHGIHLPNASLIIHTSAVPPYERSIRLTRWGSTSYNIYYEPNL